jgi:chemotaxis protein MotC
VTAAISRLQGVADGVSSAAASAPAQEEMRPDSMVERSAQQALTDADALLQRATRR